MLKRGHKVTDVAERLGVSSHTLYQWVKAAQPDESDARRAELVEARSGFLKLRGQLKRTEDERDILKNSRAVLCQRPRVKYRFINDHRGQYHVETLCRVLQASRSGFYGCLEKPKSDRMCEEERLLPLIRDSYAACGGVYGAPRVFLALHEIGETCGRHRVARLTRSHKIRAVRGYKAPRPIAGRPSIIAPNRLQREFTVELPDQTWVTDITCIRAWQGFLYLAAVIDLYARKIVGWSMKPTLAKELVLDALVIAVWRSSRQERVSCILTKVPSTVSMRGCVSAMPIDSFPA